MDVIAAMQAATPALAPGALPPGLTEDLITQFMAANPAMTRDQIIAHYTAMAPAPSAPAPAPAVPVPAAQLLPQNPPTPAAPETPAAPKKGKEKAGRPPKSDRLKILEACAAGGLSAEEATRYLALLSG